MPTYGPHELVTDRTILSRPCMNVVISLLGNELELKSTEKFSNLLIRLSSALASCARVNSISTEQRIWALQRLRKLIPLLPRCLSEERVGRAVLLEDEEATENVSG